MGLPYIVIMDPCWLFSCNKCIIRMRDGNHREKVCKEERENTPYFLFNFSVNVRLL